MSESEPSGAVDVDTEVGAGGAGEDNIHSGKTGNMNISKVSRKSSCLLSRLSIVVYLISFGPKVY